ncbi:hypothetical protein LJ656_06650 [Paraburkholderia sp. MMS20-SJTR3]|uniref:MARCKS-like protein n=1 Tax=Paraburkholderia sejongensis TaxID=2886946 RepID=A0ABS8JQS3_9BURK|nr:hypothetical protein [Paraburkholderia sp. MMS20-SJTR3]MCC8392264.1 hypothetical protein [Paraburkholderia sp. MMS20-SJTR3]
MKDTTNASDTPREPRDQRADRQDDEARQSGTEPSGNAEPAEPAEQAKPRAPGGNKLNDVAEQDVDKLVPRDRDETKLHDHSLGNADERDQPDAAGNLPGPL